MFRKIIEWSDAIERWHDRHLDDRGSSPAAKMACVVLIWVCLLVLVPTIVSAYSSAERRRAALSDYFVPGGIALLLGGGVTIFGWVASRRQTVEQRHAAGCCLQCGYDLRESRERCPECGAVVEGDQ